jgi:hypothetical protein
MLGASIQNYCVPNGIIRKYRADWSDVTEARKLLSFTNLDSAINYQNSMLNLIGTDNEPDLFVFDYGVNDNGEGGGTQYDNPDYTYMGLNTFIGSYDFVLNELFKAKPKARVVILTHYSDDASHPQFFGKDKYKKLNDAIVGLAQYWQIRLIDARHLVGWRNTKTSTDDTNGVDTISVYCPDNIHPASNPTNTSVKLLANLYKAIIKEFD